MDDPPTGVLRPESEVPRMGEGAHVPLRRLDGPDEETFESRRRYL